MTVHTVRAKVVPMPTEPPSSIVTFFIETGLPIGEYVGEFRIVEDE